MKLTAKYRKRCEPEEKSGILLVTQHLGWYPLLCNHPSCPCAPHVPHVQAGWVKLPAAGWLLLLDSAAADRIRRDCRCRLQRLQYLSLAAPPPASSLPQKALCCCMMWDTSFLLTFFRISNFSDLVRLFPTGSDSFRLIPTFPPFFRLFHSISLFFNSQPFQTGLLHCTLVWHCALVDDSLALGSPTNLARWWFRAQGRALNERARRLAPSVQQQHSRSTNPSIRFRNKSAIWKLHDQN
jgi:hypothetical protein